MLKLRGLLNPFNLKFLQSSKVFKGWALFMKSVKTGLCRTISSKPYSVFNLISDVPLARVNKLWTDMTGNEHQLLITI